jgi:hypothetical protein
MKAQEEYLARVQRLVDSLSSILATDERAEIQHLIGHGEPAEGLRALAWIIVEGNKRVSSEAIAAVRALTDGLIPAEQLPPTLDQHAVAD